ncbi:MULTISPECIES: secretion protein HlyD [Methylomonas]|uniref:HlyD family secretion protein n=1 Tax=Methylomonas methanica TaxID=421 RepID=A0ABY2CHI0_METMH|nr:MULTISPECIES: secretion protein HlyD [Methylomonas]TCV78190.1 HlyD family secretion protein [Methylomonas methanica]
MKKIIPIVIVLLIVVGSASWIYQAYRGENNATLTLYGNVDIREVTLGFRVPGKLAKLLYDEGDKVKAGEVMARLDDEPYRNQLASAQAQVDSLRARLKLRETGNRPQEIAQARSLVREREAAAVNAERLFKRAEELLADKGVSTQERDTAEANHQEAQARLKSARDNLALLEAGFRSEDITQAKADLAQTEAALATASLQLNDTVLTAPSDGVILTRAQEAGAILQAGTPVFTLSLVNPVWVRAYVHEPDLGRIHPGMQVEIRTDSAGGKRYKGQIGYISPRAEFTPKTVETTELRSSLVYRLRIVVENPDDRLRQGMPVTVTLDESTLSNSTPL